MALAYLSKLYACEKKKNFTCIIIDHGIKKASGKEAEKVKKLLQKKGIQSYVFKINLSKLKNFHLEARQLRYDKITEFCNKKKIIVLEDCAHALGTNFKGVHVGNFGITGSFSFYPTKQITTGEGGIVITNNEKIYKKIKKLKAFGIDKDINDRKKQGDYENTLLN